MSPFFLLSPVFVSYSASACMYIIVLVVYCKNHFWSCTSLEKDPKTFGTKPAMKRSLKLLLLQCVLFFLSLNHLFKGYDANKILIPNYRKFPCVYRTRSYYIIIRVSNLRTSIHPGHDCSWIHESKKGCAVTTGDIAYSGISHEESTQAYNSLLKQRSECDHLANGT